METNEYRKEINKAINIIDILLLNYEVVDNKEVDSALCSAMDLLVIAKEKITL